MSGIGLLMGKIRPFLTELLPFWFAAFEAANFQIEFFGNPVMRTAE